MISALLAALASALWGASDFSAGIGSRRIGAIRTSFWTFVGAAVLLALLLLMPESPVSPAWAWSSQAVLAGVAAAVCSAVGFLTFYTSLSLAPMGVATAIVAATEALVPVAIGVGWKGDALGWVAWAGVTAAVLVGGAEGSWGSAGLRAVLLAAVAGGAFGLAIAALDAAPQTSGFLAPTVEMIGGAILIAVMMVAVRSVPALAGAAASIGLTGEPGGRPSGAEPSPRGGVSFGLIAGVAQAFASVALMLALWSGRLSVVGAIVCLYPIVTAVLARVFLGEHLRAMHLVGIAVALFGCVLLAFA